ncbi:MAG: outer membrane lipoprotein LolB, partial [Burkholderiaceae bacterium]|nr:outer membrane lipoprotein LolB [Burkholderiaceae bacterium]
MIRAARNRLCLHALCGKWALLAVALLTALALAGCAAPEPAAPQEALRTGYWSGRLSLVIDSEPTQNFYAGFALGGSAERGQLSLYTPLGSTLAVLRWQPEQALWLQNGQARVYESMDSLTAELAGTAIPIAALFAWLQGQMADAPGWQADLAQINQGRLLA